VPKTGMQRRSHEHPQLLQARTLDTQVDTIDVAIGSP
jgi:hypothetical protein